MDVEIYSVVSVCDCSKHSHVGGSPVADWVECAPSSSLITEAWVQIWPGDVKIFLLSLTIYTSATVGESLGCSSLAA